MFTKHGKFIEIKPMAQMMNTHESLTIDTEDRKIATFHVHGPRSEKTIKMIETIKKVYNYLPFCIVLEIVTSPNKKSLSMKTLVSELVYFDQNELMSDVEQLKTFLFNQ